MILIGSCAGAIHQNSPAIDLIVKNDLYCGVSPKLGRFAAIFAVGLAPIDTGGYDALPVERGSDFSVGRTRQPHIVDPAHDASGVFIHHQLVLVPGALAVAIGRIGGNILATGLFAEKDGFDLIAQIPKMVVVHQTAEVEHIGAVALAVQTVQHGHKAAPQGGEHSVHIPSDLHIIPAQSGKVFDEDHIDALGLGVSDQTLDAGTLELVPL